MFDGVNSGTGVELLPTNAGMGNAGVTCTAGEKEALWAVMVEDAAAIRDGKEVTMYMHPRDHSYFGSTVSVTLRKAKGTTNEWFLNVQGNPTSVLNGGQNVYGSLLLKTHIDYLFFHVLAYFRRRGVDTARLVEQCRQGFINIHSITFASYSAKLGTEVTIRAIVERWYKVFEHRILIDGHYVSLLQALGLSRSEGEQRTASISLNVFEPGGKNVYMHLCTYSKLTELRENPPAEEIITSSVEEDLDGRLRLDLTVNRRFFENAWGLKRGHGGVTLRSVYSYVKKKYDGNWHAAVEDLLRYALRRTCLDYMFRMGNPFLEAHTDKRTTWETGYKNRSPGKGGKRRWEPELRTWAEEIGIDLDIAPDAHYIIADALMHSRAGTKENVQQYMSSDHGAEQVLLKTKHAMRMTRETKQLRSAMRNFQLDFSPVEGSA